MPVQGLQFFNVATVYIADSSNSDSLEGGFRISTLQDGSLAFVRNINGTYRWNATSEEDPVDPQVVLPLGSALDTPGRWLLVADTTVIPGSSYVYQPGGQAGTGVVTEESEIVPMITRAMEFGYGFSNLVIDGTFSNGVVELSSGFDLRNFFNVDFVNVENVVLSLGSQQALFRNPRDRIRADRPLRVQRDNVNEMYFVQRDNDSDLTALSLIMQYIVWDMTTFSTADVGAMVMSRSGGSLRYEFVDCSLSPDLTAPRLEDKWLWVAGTAPTSLDMVWRGEFAGELVQANSQFLYTVLIGWDTNIYYGSIYGSMLTLPSPAWAAAAPTLVDIRP